MNKPCPKCGALVRTRFYMLPMVCKGCGAELKPRMIQGRSKRPSIFWWVLAGTGMAGVVLYNNTRGLRAEDPGEGLPRLDLDHLRVEARADRAPHRGGSRRPPRAAPIRRLRRDRGVR